MISEEFKNAYKKLNPKQKEAVDTIDGPVMVIAGPGTGKTTILTLRIANILKETDTPPSGILALTFTEAGAKAMKMKLRELIGDRALEVPIHTFHGFASSVIAEFQDHFPHLSRRNQITDVESEKLIREILRDKKFYKLRPLGEPDFYINKILGAISKSKQEAWTPEMVSTFATDEIERVKNSPESISTRGASKGNLKADALKQIEKCERTMLFADVYEKYESKKQKEKKMDFDDLIFELLKALREDELFLRMLQEKYLYILVDEHQDTNNSQNSIITLLANFFESPNLFVVGDEKQAIYRFQGASIQNFIGFQNIWNNMRVISLPENYRSHQHILDASFKMIENNYLDDENANLRIRLNANQKIKNLLELITTPDIQTENYYLVEKIKEIIKTDNTATIAIIVRRNIDVARIFDLLEASNIDASAERGANIFAHPFGKMFFSLIEFLADSTMTEALAETFAGGLWHLNFVQQAEYIKLIRSGKLVEVENKIPAIGELKKEIGNSGVLSYLILAAEISGLTRIASRIPLGAEVWRGIYALATDLVTSDHIEDTRELIRSLIAYRDSAEKKIIKIKTGKVNSQISIMTAHSSKGLEFDYVYLPFITEESWIRKNRASYFVLPIEKNEEDDIRDERRLFYVSLTRARKHICMSYPRQDDSGKIFTPLRFIDELDQTCISQTNISETLRIETEISIKKIKDTQTHEQIEYTKRVLSENGLSVTALNHFLNCPNEFFYKSILKLPEPPSASSEKGNAMHEAMANVWKSKTSGKSDKIQKIIENTIKEYFKKSLLPVFEKEAILEELLTNAPIVASALSDHFADTGNILVESWVETYLKYPEVELKLHGKLDAILEKEKEILVFDYKTREAMSENALKGKTKDSDGNYFRQLVFYKILLNGNLKYNNKSVEPSLVFVKPDSKGRCPTITIPITKADVEKVQEEIKSLVQSVYSGEIINSLCDDKDCKYCSYRKLAL
ncbi:MAG: hypothetical protein A2431_00775 [Candidatus Zambryskibacteria bacterium RIFOXYC1_FULL_39_10]|uniref:DNA 3'-5' helicase n=1 Tax=Candidatus Zambryskibacteria bacterium RIFOXYC1_FULL_39_10 TaxID=1802779 RepID=A0A1G2V2D6_9BACT|nr:MAG: hypothetical protein A2605_02680 [Candidatus Zambryskibacteria bacterium RIFOXYD1_FULL_39_35]OHB15786.1 MAG: hypothetical protein A2431_00775 [Candidatus Zambryskibacteria bacterium RIFOXYC1_FULL_39_10]